MSFYDGPAQIVLLLVVFCCPLIPAGGWCWLKSIECCLGCIGGIVKLVRKFAFIIMYVCLLVLLFAGSNMLTKDFLNSEQTEEQTLAFYGCVCTAVLALFTIVLCVYSTVKCLRADSTDATQIERSEADATNTSQLERTVYIIALPAFYCLMCFLSSQQLTFYLLGTVGTHWSWDVDLKNKDQLQQFTLDMSAFYQSAASVFEALALTSFGMLTMESLKRSSMLRSRCENSVRGGGEAREIRLQSCIQSWTMSPIYIFCAVLCVESLHSLLSVFVKYFHLTDIIPPVLVHAFNNLPPSVSYMLTDNAVSISFFTLESVFSTLAIMALFSIEHVFHDDLIGVGFVSGSITRCKFFSNLKFWGVKIFVTNSFTLECILMFVNIDRIKKQLIYSVFMGTNCFLVGLLHIWAYKPCGQWIAFDGLGGTPKPGTPPADRSPQTVTIDDRRLALLDPSCFEKSEPKPEPDRKPESFEKSEPEAQPEPQLA